ncbi:hypothetical protein V8C42DRAFT_327475 [Trichoderma barbatum]
MTAGAPCMTGTCLELSCSVNTRQAHPPLSRSLFRCSSFSCFPKSCPKPQLCCRATRTNECCPCTVLVRVYTLSQYETGTHTHTQAGRQDSWFKVEFGGKDSKGFLSMREWVRLPGRLDLASPINGPFVAEFFFFFRPLFVPGCHVVFSCVNEPRPALPLHEVPGYHITCTWGHCRSSVLLFSLCPPDVTSVTVLPDASDDGGATVDSVTASCFDPESSP